ncbi:MAG: hypothetical protein AB7F89_07815 [Pirellulaceae bacterium]
MNDTQIARQTTDRLFLIAGHARRAVASAVLAGTIFGLVATGRVDAQDPRYSLANTAVDAQAQPPVVVEPGYEYGPPETYGYDNYGWGAPPSADCGMGCPPTWRTRVEALMMNREGDTGATLSSGIRMSDFDYTEGGRLTIGQKYDCTLGWEVTYTGIFEWEEGGLANAPGTLNTLLVAGSPAINLSAFNGANQHQQFHQSRLQSVEAVQKWWGRDVLTTSAGIRWIHVDEDFDFRSVDANNVDIGLFTIDTTNNLIGAQLGIDLLYPIDRWSVDSTLKGGLFANIGESNVFLSNAGVVQFDNSAEDLEFAAMVEYGAYVRYAISPRVNVRAGYEFLWIYGLGIATEQIRNPIATTTGRSFDGQGDTFYHGGTAGIEFIW